MVEWNNLLPQGADLLLEWVAQPLLFNLGLGGWVEDAYEACEWVLWGLIELTVMVALMWPLQKLWPAEHVSALHGAQRQSAIRVDVIYTMIHRLGLFQCAHRCGHGVFASSRLAHLPLGAVATRFG